MHGNLMAVNLTLLPSHSVLRIEIQYYRNSLNVARVCCVFQEVARTVSD